MPVLSTDRRALLGVTLVWAALLLIIRPWGNFPSNDDWSWTLAVDAVVNRHRWQLTDFTGMPLATQIVWASLFCLPLGYSLMALRLSTLVLAWFAVAGVFALLRECGATRAQGLLGSAAVLFSPVFFALSITFMTDIPFVACSIWAVLLAIRYQRDGRPRQLAGLVVLLLAASLQRQLGVPLAAGIGAALAFAGRRWLAPAIVIAVPGAALAAYNMALARTGVPFFYYYASGGLVGALKSGSPLIWRAAAVGALASYVYLGLMMLPVVLASVPLRRRTAKVLAIDAAIAVVALVGVVYKRLWMPINENILHDVGLNLVSLGRRDLWPQAPHAFWIALTLTGVVCAAVVMHEIMSTTFERRKEILDSPGSVAPLITLAAAFAMSTVPLWFVQGFDRYYLLPFVLLLALWTYLHATRPSGLAAFSGAAAWTVIVLVAAFDTISLRDYYAFTRARWDAVASVRATGVPADDIDGGFEVNGLLSYHPDRPFDPRHAWYQAKARPAVLLSLGPVEGYTVKEAHEFHRWMPPGSGAVYVLTPSPAKIGVSGTR